MFESNAGFIIAFPGQGTKDYPGNPAPEEALFNESLDNFGRISTFLPHIRKLRPFVYGNSFGQFQASVAAESISRLDGLELVRARNRIVSCDEERRVAGDHDRTGMALLLGFGREVIEGLVERKSALYRSVLDMIDNKRPPEDLQVSNFNGVANHVLGGDRKFLDKLVAHLNQSAGQARTHARMLLIEGAYHIKAREKASEEFSQAIEDLGIVFNNPIYPVISSTAPRVMKTGEEIKQEFVQQLRREVDILKVAALWRELGISSALDPGPGQFVNQVIKRAYGEGLWVVSLDDRKQQKGALEDPLQKFSQLIAAFNRSYPGI
jgi:malonyl CoA-acyl carrier protein transacylase